MRADVFRIRIGCKRSIQDNCVVHAGRTDAIIGDNVIIGHGSIIHCARIGGTVLIGMHSSLMDFSEIGDFCIVGAHSIVKDSFKVPPRSLASGIPTRIKRTVNKKEMENIILANEFYVDLSKKFKKQRL